MEDGEVNKPLSIEENRKRAARLANELRLHKEQKEEEENLQRAADHKEARDRMIGGDN